MRILENRLKDMLAGKTKSNTNKILKKLLAEQAAHINFLSDQLLTSLDQSDSDSDKSTFSAADEDSDNQQEIYHALGERARAAGKLHSRDSSTPSLANVLQETSSSDDDEDFL